MPNKGEQSKPDINPFERAILHVLSVAQRPLTTKKVSERTGMTWQTADKYLNRLRQKRYVSNRAYKNRVYWFLI